MQGVSKGNPTLACHCMCVNYWMYERNSCIVMQINFLAVE